MNSTTIYAAVSVVIVSLLSLIGVSLLFVGEHRIRRGLFILVSLSVGGLFGDAFIHLVPESIRDLKSDLTSALLIITGIFTFFILEKVLQWRHVHTIDSNSVSSVGYMNLFADTIHNFIDGALIGSSYMVSLHIGITTTIAVVLHEIPHEIGNFGILLHSGFTVRRALLFNFLSALAAVLGTTAAIAASEAIGSFSMGMIPFTAGGFIYIAGTDLVPELHKDKDPLISAIQLFAMVCGVCLMMLLEFAE